MNRLRLTCAALLGAVTLMTVPVASAQWPDRAINLVVPHAVGSTADVGARMIAEKLRARLGQPLVIENRAGAGGSIGLASALRAPADGYTLILIAISNTINHVLRKDLAFDILRDVQPISLGWTSPNVGVIPPSMEPKTLVEFIAYAKLHPGSVNYASSGIGTSQHFAGEMLKMLTGIKMEHIPYKVGTQSVTDALGGAKILVFNSIPLLRGHIETGALRALGVTSTSRSPALPNVPTFHEAGVPGFDINAWWGFGVRAGTPDAIVSRLSEAIVAVLNDPDLDQRLKAMGASAAPLSGSAYAEFLKADVAKYDSIVKAAGIRIE